MRSLAIGARQHTIFRILNTIFRILNTIFRMSRGPVYLPVPGFFGRRSP